MPALVERRLFKDAVVEALRRRILEGTFKPGQKLNEPEMAESLEVSRGPVREALRQLASEGLVVAIPQRGSFVARLTADDAAEICLIRSLIESAAAERLARLASSNELSRLESLVSRMKRAAAKGNSATLQKLDVEFHRTICELSGYARLLQIWTTMSEQLRFILAGLDPLDYLGEQVVDEHEKILGSLMRQDDEEAVRLVRDHIAGTLHAILERLSSTNA